MPTTCQNDNDNLFSLHQTVSLSELTKHIYDHSISRIPSSLVVSTLDAGSSTNSVKLDFMYKIVDFFLSRYL